MAKSAISQRRNNNYRSRKLVPNVSMPRKGAYSNPRFTQSDDSGFYKSKEREQDEDSSISIILTKGKDRNVVTTMKSVNRSADNSVDDLNQYSLIRNQFDMNNTDTVASLNTQTSQLYPVNSSQVM